MEKQGHLLGLLIQDRRKKRGITLGELANASGTMETEIKQYEAGEIVSDARTLKRVAGALAVDPAYFEFSMLSTAVPTAQAHTPNEAHVAGDVAYIILTDRTGNRVAEAIIDCKDLKRVLAYSRWHLHPAGYAISTPNRHTGKRRILLHRFTLNAPAGRVVDHIFGQRLDCRAAALRLGSQSENLQNTVSKPSGKSGQRNVHWQAKVKKWQVKIVVRGHTHCLGSYDDVVVAAAVALEARRSLHPFCRENVTVALPTLP